MRRKKFLIEQYVNFIIIEWFLRTLYDEGLKHSPSQIISTDMEHILTPQVSPQDSVFDMIENENHVLIEWMSHLEVLAEQKYKKSKMCEYSLSTEQFFYEHVAMAFPKNSPWLTKFNAEIRKMLQSGLTIQWKKVSIILKLFIIILTCLQNKYLFFI